LYLQRPVQGGIDLRNEANGFEGFGCADVFRRQAIVEDELAKNRLASFWGFRVPWSGVSGRLRPMGETVVLLLADGAVTFPS